MALFFFSDEKAINRAYSELISMAREALDRKKVCLENDEVPSPFVLSDLRWNSNLFTKEELKSWETRINASNRLSETQRLAGWNSFARNASRFADVYSYLWGLDGIDGSLNGNIDFKGKISQLSIDTSKMPANLWGGSFEQFGEISYYGADFQGKMTASGSRFDPTKHTLAHPTLPMGTLVELCCVRDDGSPIVVTAMVTDRGPFAKDKRGNPRIADVTPAVFKLLNGNLTSGVMDITLRVKQFPDETGFG